MTEPELLASFVQEFEPGEYKDFELLSDDAYPLKGITYPVKYGEIPGYIAEDGAYVDLLVGAQDGIVCGEITVFRGEAVPNERKFFVQCTKDEVQAIIEAYGPVLTTHKEYDDFSELQAVLQTYKSNAKPTH